MSAMKNRKELLTMNSRGLWNHSPDTANIKFGSNRSTVREFARQRRTEHGFRHALVRAKCSLIEFRAMQTTMALVLILTILTFFEKEGQPFCQINFIDKATPYLSLYKGSGSLQFNWTTRVFYKYLPHMKVGCSGVDIETPHKLLLTLQQDNTPNENGNFLHLNL